MKFEILNYVADVKGSRLGYVDFSVEHTPENKEIFRKVTYCEKDGKTWLAIGKVPRGVDSTGKEQWKFTYERTPSMKPLFDGALAAFKEYRSRNEIQLDEVPF